MTYLTAFYVIVVNNNLFHYVNAALINLVAIANSTTWLTKVFDCLHDKDTYITFFKWLLKKCRQLQKVFDI